jgi:electron transport complex protein RnfC
MRSNALRAFFSHAYGLHPPHHKQATEKAAIVAMPVPPNLYLSLSQHLGAPSRPVVKKGDNVTRGQLVAEPAGYVSATVHAPCAGVVKAIEEMPTVSGRTTTVIAIETTGNEEPAAGQGLGNEWTMRSPRELVEIVARAGIVGMGGAGFPTHVKLAPPEGKTIDTLIVNGAECEPYLTADHRLMIEEAGKIWEGIAIIRRILGVKRVFIGIEDNKPNAIKAMQARLTDTNGDVKLATLKTKYPQGAEKQLIQTLTGREAPSGGLPMDVGALVENVATAAAIRDAVIEGLPLTHRVVTVTGDCVHSPGNVLAPIGTTLKDLVDFCGGLKRQPAKIICGGPMMGKTLPSLEPGIDKTTSGILLLSGAHVARFTSMPCIACGRCVAACPMRLMPCLLSEFIENQDFESAGTYGVKDCIECGLCAFVCPAYRPMVQHMQLAKARIKAMTPAKKHEQSDATRKPDLK